jgi:hypothetical protein
MPILQDFAETTNLALPDRFPFTNGKIARYTCLGRPL